MRSFWSSLPCRGGVLAGPEAIATMLLLPPPCPLGATQSPQHFLRHCRPHGFSSSVPTLAVGSARPVLAPPWTWRARISTSGQDRCGPFCPSSLPGPYAAVFCSVEPHTPPSCQKDPEFSLPSSLIFKSNVCGVISPAVALHVKGFPCSLETQSVPVLVAPPCYGASALASFPHR